MAKTKYLSRFWAKFGLLLKLAKIIAWTGFLPLSIILLILIDYDPFFDEGWLDKFTPSIVKTICVSFITSSIFYFIVVWGKWKENNIYTNYYIAPKVYEILYEFKSIMESFAIRAEPLLREDSESANYFSKFYQNTDLIFPNKNLSRKILEQLLNGGHFENTIADRINVAINNIVCLNNLIYRVMTHLDTKLLKLLSDIEDCPFMQTRQMVPPPPTIQSDDIQILAFLDFQKKIQSLSEYYHSYLIPFNKKKQRDEFVLDFLEGRLT